MLLNDVSIRALAEQGMIDPFVPEMVREYCSSGQSGFWRKSISYGLGSYGYDLRLSPDEFRIFRHIPGEIVNPKRFNPECLETAKLHSDDDGDFFIIPANSYALGVAVERLCVPDDITVVCLGKSTLARCGIIANVTPAEASWAGYLTLEFSNASNADCRMYANEGVVQLLFMQGQPCQTTYQGRNGKYQDQPQHIVLPIA
jgi:dCTP deaminase